MTLCSLTDSERRVAAVACLVNCADDNMQRKVSERGREREGERERERNRERERERERETFELR